MQDIRERYDFFEYAANVVRADVCRLSLLERFAPPRFELGPTAHRVLELGAVRLDAKRRAGGGPLAKSVQ